MSPSKKKKWKKKNHGPDVVRFENIISHFEIKTRAELKQKFKGEPSNIKYTNPNEIIAKKASIKTTIHRGRYR